MNCLVSRWVEAANAAALDIATQAFGWEARVRVDGLESPFDAKGTIETQAFEHASTELAFGPVRARLVLLRSPSAQPRSRPRTI